MRKVVVGLALVMSGCGAGAPPDAAFPSSGSSSYGSGSMSTSAPSGVPAHETITAGIVVRPDRICVPFAVRVLETDPERAVAIAQGVAGEIGAALAKAAGGAGAVRMRGIAVAPAGSGKAVDETRFALVADGAFDVPVVASADFWARSRVLAALIATTKRETDARATSGATVVFETPRFELADVEAHRAALTKAWTERARGFAEAAQSPGAALSLVDCAVPGEIVERAISSEEIGLTLAIACRLDARAAAK